MARSEIDLREGKRIFTKRCPHMGSCTGTKCALINESTLTETATRKSISRQNGVLGIMWWVRLRLFLSKFWIFILSRLCHPTKFRNIRSVSLCAME
ncbi:unnamed protein product [Cylicostephanus goldi]|uniref:Uncharacterized protein n=1 Tax=Cylicostephanus goldi TaxID=71465 RepID=A0A3P7MEM9_CYLGO|nr:unnamed protein product [Cylicostephanus goldi]